MITELPRCSSTWSHRDCATSACRNSTWPRPRWPRSSTARRTSSLDTWCPSASPAMLKRHTLPARLCAAQQLLPAGRNFVIRWNFKTHRAVKVVGGADGAVFATMLQTFAKDNNTAIRSETYNWDVFFQKMPTAVAAGTPPDWTIFHAAEVPQKKYREALMAVSPGAVADFDAKQAKYAEDLAKADELKLKNDAARGDQMRGHLMAYESQSDAAKQANWQNFLNGAMKKGITQEELLGMPTTYPGKDWMLAHANGYALGSQLSKEEIDRRTAAAHEKTAQTAADRLAVETPGIQAKNFSDQLMTAAKTLGNVQDQAGYDAWLKTLPSDQLRQWAGATFSPQRKDAILMAAVGPAEAARLKGEAEKRAEEARHNKANETQAAQNAAREGVLSPTDAAMLGVPYGTTKAQANGRTAATQQQYTDAGFAERMAAANGIMEDLAKRGTKGNTAASRWANSSLVPNEMIPGESLQLQQAQRDFVNAQLRRESGAAISESEFDNARKQYFPQPGDSDAVVAQKKEARERAQQNMGRGAGGAYRPNAPVPAPASPGRGGSPTVKLYTPNGGVINVPESEASIYISQGAHR